jgi:hypothetical protein
LFVLKKDAGVPLLVMLDVAMIAGVRGRFRLKRASPPIPALGERARSTLILKKQIGEMTSIHAMSKHNNIKKIKTNTC